MFRYWNWFSPYVTSALFFLCRNISAGNGWMLITLKTALMVDMWGVCRKNYRMCVGGRALGISLPTFQLLAHVFPTCECVSMNTSVRNHKILEGLPLLCFARHWLITKCRNILCLLECPCSVVNRMRNLGEHGSSIGGQGD